MKNRHTLKTLTACLLAGAIVLPSFAEDASAPKPADAKPDDSQMMAIMMEMAKPGEKHKMMENSVGHWAYKTKFWMSPDPSTPPMESGGTAVTKALMDGRYFQTEHTGKFQMPGADGKMMDMEFKGMAIDGYDNGKAKFVSSWIDNMGTGIMKAEGTYDAAAKTITYSSEYTPMPGMTIKMRQVLTLVDNDHHHLTFFEDRGGKEVKTMEIVYTRQK
jgi:hypothetical protein